MAEIPWLSIAIYCVEKLFFICMSPNIDSLPAIKDTIVSTQSGYNAHNTYKWRCSLYNKTFGSQTAANGHEAFTHLCGGIDWKATIRNSETHVEFILRW